MSSEAAHDLSAACRYLVEPGVGNLTTGLAGIPDLGEGERQAIRSGLIASLTEKVMNRVIRVLLLDLHIARVTGRLTATDPAGRWDQWREQISRPDFWPSMSERYPTLLDRVRTLVDNSCTAALTMARRFAADRDHVASLAGGEAELTEVSFGAGDSHRGGQTVCALTLTGGRAYYKPRPLAVDAVLARFLAEVVPDDPPGTRIRIPDFVDRGDYGWTAHVAHRWCADDEELRCYYRNLGHWLAVTRLLGTGDLHRENLIAAGPVPVVIDCETLFTPYWPLPASGFGEAHDRAVGVLDESLLRTGLLPGRGGRLGLRGVDVSAAGGLAGEQPEQTRPVILDPGTDQARLGFETVPIPASHEHQPTPGPRLHEMWHHVVEGYESLTAGLAELDRRGRLEPLLAPFRTCEVRILRRDTIVYSELETMLWHPAALHREEVARARVARLLTAQAEHSPSATDDPAVVEAEIADLLVADVPVFTTVAGTGEITGPGGVPAGSVGDLVGAALQRWRQRNEVVDREVLECAVVSAYREEGGYAATTSLEPTKVDTTDLERRRRRAAAGLVATLAERAVTGSDGTITWIAPVLGPTGMAVQPVGLEMYSGLPGIALLLAAYAGEVAAGRADPVPEVDDMLTRALATLRTMEDRVAAERRDHPDARPEMPGGYVGLGSRIWGWLALARLGAVDREEAVARSSELAAQVPAAVAEDDEPDVLVGRAGAIVPLLRLAEASGDDRWRREAASIGERLAAAAITDDRGARWSGFRSPDGLGGFAHGSLGIGWALGRLADATGEQRFADLAEAAFRYQEWLWDEAAGGWRDPRKPAGTASNWCYGCDGMAAVAEERAAGPDGDRWRNVLRRAAAATVTSGLGETHTLCHGDLGSVETVRAAAAAGVAPPGVTLEDVSARLVSSLEEFGPRCAATTAVFRPGLMAGSGGIVYTLLRLHPDCRLPSLLLPDPGPAGSR